MTAEEMFRELGFSFWGEWCGMDFTYAKNEIKIGFNCDKQTINFLYDDYDSNWVEIDKKLHKAIHQQLIELGWV